MASGQPRNQGLAPSSVTNKAFCAPPFGLNPFPRSSPVATLNAINKARSDFAEPPGAASKPTSPSGIAGRMDSGSGGRLSINSRDHVLADTIPLSSLCHPSGIGYFSFCSTADGFHDSVAGVKSTTFPSDIAEGTGAPIHDFKG